MVCCSRRHPWSSLPAVVVMTILTLVRAGADSFRGGWGRHYIATLPVQIIGQFGWCLGEALMQARAALMGIDRSVFRERT